MSRKAHLSLCWLVIAAVFTLVGCGGNIDRTVTFYKDEAWEADIEFSLPGELIALVGSPEELEADIGETVAAWEEKGADVSWDSRRQETTLIYSFHVEGEGLSLLNEIVFENRAALRVEDAEGQRQIYFSYRTSNDLAGASSDNVTLHGREIVSSNGEQIDSGTVQWVNFGGQLEAVLTEKSQFSLGTLLLIAVGVVGIGSGGWFVWQRRQQPHPLPQATAFCSNCGAPRSPQAKFCPSCGHPQ